MHGIGCQQETAHADHRNVARREAAAARRLSHARDPRPRRQRGADQGAARQARRALRQAGVQGRRRQEGQGRADRPRARPEDRAGREGAPVLRRTPPRPPARQGQRRDLRGRGAGRARGLLLAHRQHALSRTDDDADAPRRHGHRGAGQVATRGRALQPADRAEGLRRRQRTERTEGAEGHRLAAGAAPAEPVGPVPRLRHDHARAQPDPPARRHPRPPDAGGLRLQVRLRPRRPALAAAEPAAAPVRRRHQRLRAGDQPAAHLPGAERRLRHQRQGHDPRADLRRRRQFAGHRDARRRRDHLAPTSAATRPTRR